MSVINHENKFIWIHVPKNAGSSIHNNLQKNNIYCGALGNHDTFNNITNMLEQEKLEEYFKWAFVRNPYERLASAYFHTTNAHFFRKYTSFDDFLLKDFYSKDGFLSIKNSSILIESTLKSTAHFDTQTSYLIDKNNKINFNFIGKIENINFDWQVIIEKLKLKEKNLQIYNSRVDEKLLPNKVIDPVEPEKARITEDYLKYYEGPNYKEKIEIVNFLYKEDFENFKYIRL
jgi:hypothetical protein